MTLPNLAALADNAANVNAYHRGETDDIPNGQQAVKDRARLIAAAPDMAALLIECAEALADLIPWAGRQTFENEAAWDRARAALARLADFDGRIR